jgi:hypothetical protein
MSNKVLTHNLSEAIGNVAAADVDITPGDGNLVVDGHSGNEKELAGGTLQYLEKNGPPAWSVDTGSMPARFKIKSAGKGQHWLHLPWAACNGATNWHIHLNRRVISSVNAQSNGGNITLSLGGMPLTRVTAFTGGGNIELTIPDPGTTLSITAKSGAGNVIVHVPGNTAARIKATTGLGKLILGPRFLKTGRDSYQSLDYDTADRKIDMDLSSGAGNVAVEEMAAS